MRRGNQCLCENCTRDPLPGYRYCPDHLTEALIIDGPMSERLTPYYEAYYEDAEVGDADRAYVLCANGFEVASMFDAPDGTRKFWLVRID